MARKRASMREGPLAELFRATEAAQRSEGDDEPVDEPLPPAAEADDQQTLILDAAGRAGRSRRAAAPRGSCARGDGRARRCRPRRRRAGARKPRSRRPSSTSTISTLLPPAAEPRRGRARRRAVAALRLRRAASRRRPLRARARPRRAARAAVRAACEPIHPADARGRAATQRRRRGGVVPRGDPRRRRRRRWAQRGQPDDGCRHRPGRFRRRQHRHAAAQPLGCAGEDPHRRGAHPGPRLGRRSGDRPPRRRGGVRPGSVGAARLRHGVRHRRRGRRHRHRRRSGRGQDRPRSRRADGRHRDDAVQVRGHEAPPVGRLGRRGASRRLRHGDRDPERPAARGPRPLDLDGRRVQDRRRRAPAGRAGHLRPDHDARPDQPRLRRRAHDHVRRRLGPDGHRLLGEREPRPRGRRARAQVSADRHRDRRRQGHPALDRRRRGSDACSRSTRRPRSSAAPRPTTPTSSSAPRSTSG